MGDALNLLWGPPFYQEHLVPMLRRFEVVLDALDTYDLAKRLGIA